MLGELKDYLGSGEIDLNDIRVTLDLIPLTVSTEDEVDAHYRRPCFSRLVSTTSEIGMNTSTANLKDNIILEEGNSTANESRPATKQYLSFSL